MRTAVLTVLIAMFLALSVCRAAPSAPADAATGLVYLGAIDGIGDYYLDTRTIKVKANHITVRYYIRSQKLEFIELLGGTLVQEVEFIPAERMGLITVRASIPGYATTTSAPYWLYVPADAEIDDRAMRLALAYCRSQGILVDTAPPPYASPDFLFVLTDDKGAHHFFNPASVSFVDGLLTFRKRTVFQSEPTRVRYLEATTQVDLAAKKFRGLDYRGFAVSGGKLAVRDLDLDTAWYDIPPGSHLADYIQNVVDYCREQGIPLAK